jgi:hypothetical protein
VFENRVATKIFGPKRDEVTADWILHYEEFHDPYCLPHIRVMKSTKNEMGGACGTCVRGQKGILDLSSKT